ncbi:MAG: T9SS type A sorting domain-containing protein, partial [Bacteroidia bacterium]|nr:T9SS type A sorting domain-containing protein [Bacteroidia bacterium]
THIINSWSEFDIDTLTSNDLFSGYSIKNPYTLSNDTVNFETTDASDYYLIDIAQYCNAYVSSYAAHNSTKGLQMTGGDAMQYYTELEIPDGSNTWDINECLSVKVSFCVDATGWSTANMSFDLKQTFSTIYQMYAGYDFPMGSCFRVLVNDEQISGTYFPTTYSSDPWETLYFNLDGFAGTNFTVCFETRNIIKRNMIPGYPDVGDNSYIDNVIFSEEPLGFKEFSQGESLEIYPNPSDNYFIAEYFSENSGLIKAEITNMLGKIMLSKTMHAGQGRNTIPVDLTEYPSGIYIIKIFSGQGTITERIVRI